MQLRRLLYPTLWSPALALALSGAAGLVASAPTPVAAAEKAKKDAKKKAGAKADDEAAEEKKDEAAKPADPNAPADPTARKSAATFKVETELDRKAVQQADKKRDEAIEELKKLIPKAPESRKAEMIFRLAELYWMKSKYNYGLEMQTYEKEYTAWNDSGRQGKEPEVTKFTRQSELIKQNALKLYEKVLGEFPTYERNDEVLFYLGYNEYETGNRDKAVDLYWKLIKQFPKSRLVSDAYLQLGEHFFNTNKVHKARKAYEHALGTQVEKVRNYALYKLAWCDYNVQEYAAGITKLKEVIDSSEKLEKGGAGVKLKDEALGDLARFFSYVDETDTAFEYFKLKGGEDIALRYTVRLGELFHDQGKWDLEINTFRMLNDKYPMNGRAPDLQSRIVTAFSKLNKKDMVRKEVERLVDLYRPGTPWYKAQEKKNDKAALEYAYDLTESNLRDLVTEYHRDAMKRQDVPTYVLARDIYKKYLDAFDQTDSAYEMRFFYAEVLWALKEWKNAAEQYDIVVADAKEGMRGKYARIAAYNAVLAWEKIVAEGEKGALDSDIKIVEKKGKKGTISRQETQLKLVKLDQAKEYKEETIPEIELKLSAACDIYFKIADPKEEELPGVKFKAAYIYYKHNHFVEAAKRYNELIERWPGTDLSKKSAHLILDSLNVQEKWDDLEKYARAFRDNKPLVGKDATFLAEVQALVEGASFKSVLVAEAAARKNSDEEAMKKGLAEAATRFRAFQKEFDKSQYADKAVYNALVIYNKADELDHAIEAAELLMDGYKKSELYTQTHFLLAGFYERIADFKKSADLYAGFYKDHKDAKEAADALYNAGLYYQGIGETKLAIEHYEKYLVDFKDKKDVADIYWRICEIYDGEQNWKKSTECWEKFKERYKTAPESRHFEARYRLALVHDKQKKKKDLENEFKYLVKAFPKLDKKDQEAPGAQLAAAHAAFWLLEPEFEAFQKMAIKLNKQSLEGKAKKSDELACIPSETAACKTPGKYFRLLEYKNGDYGIAALARIGQIFRDFSMKLRDAPIPGRLTEEQREIYVAELENLALGPEEKAIQAFELALEKAYELNIYNEYTLLAQDNLRQLNPNKFPDPQKVEPRGAEGFLMADIVSETPAPSSASREAKKDDALVAKGDGT